MESLLKKDDEEITQEILKKRRTRVVFPNVYAARTWALVAGAIITWVIWVSKEVTKVSILKEVRPLCREAEPRDYPSHGYILQSAPTTIDTKGEKK